MHVVIVYESLFGNTRQVAEAIGAGVREARPDAEVDCVRVDKADRERVGSADLLIVGGPTHMRGMPSGLSRKIGLQSEKKQAEDESERPRHEAEEDAEGPGLRDWFHELLQTRGDVRAAAFDTRGDFRFMRRRGTRHCSCGCEFTATDSSRNRRGSSPRTPRDPSVKGSSTAPRPGARLWADGRSTSSRGGACGRGVGASDSCAALGRRGAPGGATPNRGDGPW